MAYAISSLCLEVVGEGTKGQQRDYKLKISILYAFQCTQCSMALNVLHIVHRSQVDTA